MVGVYKSLLNNMSQAELPTHMWPGAFTVFTILAILILASIWATAAGDLSV